MKTTSPRDRRRTASPAGVGRPNSDGSRRGSQRAAPLLADASGAARAGRTYGLFSTALRMTATAQTLAVICQRALFAKELERASPRAQSRATRA